MTERTIISIYLPLILLFFQFFWAILFYFMKEKFKTYVDKALLEENKKIIITQQARLEERLKAQFDVVNKIDKKMSNLFRYLDEIRDEMHNNYISKDTCFALREKK